MSFPINPDESEYFSDGHESDSPQEDQMEGPAMREEEKQPRLSAEEVDILEEHLEEWAGLKGEKRRLVTLWVQQQIKDLEANEYIGPVEWNIKKEAIKDWLQNHSRSWARKGSIKEQKQKDIQDVLRKQGIGAGSTIMIGSYQKAVGEVMQKLSKDDWDEANWLAEVWNTTKAPPDVQAELAEKKGRDYCRAFAKEMWQKCGTRVVMMVAWKDGNGGPMAAIHDFNDTLDDRKLFPDGSVIEKHWLNYAWDIFWVDNEGQGDDTDGEDGPPRKKIARGRKRPEITLPVLDDGTAQLPNVLEMRAQEKKDLLQTFLTHHYCLVSGQSKATVPWLSITENPQLYFADRYFPEKIPFKEPTKLTYGQVTEILHFWRQ
ncbi:hypothetical protein SCLCIDRAFT_33768 [Scleroderma citrinum Foug A]|uniref:Uncharacterized protein n=1 Tax=Scleroderma citrinum Foug A TaxID=1036808 RepID=A0A0C3D4Q6_9AGAM|nr:hypothetical protein SCLCIDRAFT_33768 [Scleroderma citrinum Foug A]